jgi:hypothetical protein
MRRSQQILIANGTALLGSILILALLPKARTSAVWLIPVLLSLGLVNTTYWLLPHLGDNKVPRQSQAILTLVLLLLAGLVSWIWIH